MYVMASIFTLAGCVLLLNTIDHLGAVSGFAVREGVVVVYFTQALVAFGVGTVLFGIAGLRDRIERLRPAPVPNAHEPPGEEERRAILAPPAVDPLLRPPGLRRGAGRGRR